MIEKIGLGIQPLDTIPIV